MEGGGKLPKDDGSGDGGVGSGPTPTLFIDLDTLNPRNLNDLVVNGIPLQNGELIRFSVSGNPSTGYSWNLTEGADNGAFAVTSTF